MPKINQIIFLCFLILSLFVSGIAGKIFGSNADRITILQNGDGSLDIDFVLPGETTPSFRLLCPEHIGTIDRNREGKIFKVSFTAIIHYSIICAICAISKTSD